MEMIVGYEAPVVEIIEVEVEVGFCQSVGPRVGDWDKGDPIQ